MKKREHADWLIYSTLVGTVTLAVVLIWLGPADSLLSFTDLPGIFAIIVPVLIGQLALLYKWRAKNWNNQHEVDSVTNIPKNIIRLPLILCFGIVFLPLIFRGLGLYFEWKSILSEHQIKMSITFSMSVMNASIVLFIADVFKTKE